jgi:hypothetical protein
VDRKRPVKIEVSQNFYEKLQDEKLRRNLTIQQMILRALERYLAVPESLHRQLEEECEREGRSVEREAQVSMEIRLRQYRKSRGADAAVALPPMSAEEREAHQRRIERFELADEIKQFLGDLPVDKLRSLRESVKLDLKYYRSARIKEKKTRGSVTKEPPAGED